MAGRPSNFSYARQENRRPSRQKYNMYFAELERMMRFYANRGESNREQASARQIVWEELGKLGQEVLEPVYKRRAPVRAGTRKKLLRDTIQAVRRRRVGAATPEIRVQMASWGEYTIQGRGGLRPRPFSITMRTLANGHVIPVTHGMFKLVLPGGQVIFRREVGAATLRAYSTGELAPWDGQNHPEDFSNSKKLRRELGLMKVPFNRTYPPLNVTAGRNRMRWAEFAWDDIKKSGVLDQLQRNIVRRMLASSALVQFAEFAPGSTDSNTARQVETYQAYLRGELTGETSAGFTRTQSPVNYESLREEKVRRAKRRNRIEGSTKKKGLANRERRTQEKHRKLLAEYETVRNEIEFLEDELRDADFYTHEELTEMRATLKRHKARLAALKSELKHADAHA